MATAVMCVLSWSSPALPMIVHPGAKIFVTDGQGTLLSSIAALGASFGPFVTGWLADSCGRKTTLLGGMLLSMATWAVLYFCSVFGVLVCARFLAGTCVGCVYGILPMYVAEIAPVSSRVQWSSINVYWCVLNFNDVVGKFTRSTQHVCARFWCGRLHHNEWRRELSVVRKFVLGCRIHTVRIVSAVLVDSGVALLLAKLWKGDGSVARVAIFPKRCRSYATEERNWRDEGETSYFQEYGTSKLAMFTNSNFCSCPPRTWKKIVVHSGPCFSREAI